MSEFTRIADEARGEKRTTKRGITQGQIDWKDNVYGFDYLYRSLNKECVLFLGDGSTHRLEGVERIIIKPDFTGITRVTETEITTDVMRVKLRKDHEALLTDKGVLEITKR